MGGKISTFHSPFDSIMHSPLQRLHRDLADERDSRDERHDDKTSRTKFYSGIAWKMQNNQVSPPPFSCSIVVTWPQNFYHRHDGEIGVIVYRSHGTNQFVPKMTRDHRFVVLPS